MRSFRQYCEFRETAVNPGNVQLVNANAASIAKALNGLPQGPQVLAALNSLTSQSGVQLVAQQQAPAAKPPAAQQQVSGQVAGQPARPGQPQAQPVQGQQVQGQQVVRPGVAQPAQPAQPVQAGAAVPGKR